MEGGIVGLGCDGEDVDAAAPIEGGIVGFGFVHFVGSGTTPSSFFSTLAPTMMEGGIVGFGGDGEDVDAAAPIEGGIVGFGFVHFVGSGTTPSSFSSTLAPTMMEGGIVGFGCEGEDVDAAAPIEGGIVGLGLVHFVGSGTTPSSFCSTLAPTMIDGGIVGFGCEGEDVDAAAPPEGGIVGLGLVHFVGSGTTPSSFCSTLAPTMMDG